MGITRKLQRTAKDQYTLTVPKTLVQLLNWSEQDLVEFGLEGNTITIKKAPKQGGKK
jgi:bifunctional DNA-binding transcriptional regulator/antitoxin component of YhaV-PrlF toxin-antitoxin module